MLIFLQDMPYRKAYKCNLDEMLRSVTGVDPITKLRTCIIKKKHSREVTQCGKSNLSYHKELRLKERIRSLWEQVLSFKRSSHFGKGRS